MNNTIYLRIYQPSEDCEFTHHDLFNTGKLSSMLGHGLKQYTFKSGDVSLVVSKSPCMDDYDSINLALVKIKELSQYNPWKSYGEFECFDVDFIHSKTVSYSSEYKSSSGKIFDIARSIGTGHQNSAKTRELALFMLLHKHS